MEKSMLVRAEHSQAIIDDFVSAAHGSLHRVVEVLAERPNLLHAKASWRETAIQAAAHMARRDIARHLLARGAELDLCTAAVMGLLGRVTRQLSVDPSLVSARGAHGFPLMYYPAITGDIDMAALLWKYGVDLNAGAGASTALHGAAAAGHYQMVQWLITHRANARVLDRDGKRPLQVAMDAGQLEIAGFLRESGAVE
jgi:uncharacterized protein